MGGSQVGGNWMLSGAGHAIVVSNHRPIVQECQFTATSDRFPWTQKNWSYVCWGEGQILSDPDCLRAAVNLMIWFVRHPKVSWRREVKRPGCLTWHFEVKEVDSDFWGFPNKGLSTPWDSVLMRMMIAMKIILIWCRLWKNASLCQSAIMFQHATLIQCNWQENHGQSWRCRDLSTISTIWAFLVRAWHLWLKFGVSEI